MGADQHIDWAAHTTSVLDWWRDAGVDVLVDEAPRNWLTQDSPPAPASTVTAVAESPVAAGPPDTLDAFIAWRTGPDAPEGQGGLLVEGDPAADLMVVADFPEGDGLLDGAAGRLFDRMLAAIGLTRDSVYLTVLTTVRPLGGRVPPEAMPSLAALLTHHIDLVQPKRLLIFGQAPSRAITGTDAARAPRNLHAVNLRHGTVHAVTSLHPRYLIERPAMKAEAWKDLQLLIGKHFS